MSQDSVLLDYVIVPNSVYYTRDPLNPSTVTLTIGVSNSTGSAVDIRGFQVLIPVSSDPNDQNALTTSASSIQPVSLQPTTWSFQRVGDGLFRAVPIPPVTGVKAGESITFQLAGLAVNQAHGTAQVIFTQYEKDGTTLTKPRQVEKIRSTLNIDSFAGYPVNIASGDPVLLSWTTTAAARLTLLPGNFTDLKPNDSITVKPYNTTVYTLTVYGEGPDISKQFTITVDPPKIVVFTAAPEKINAGDEVALDWEVENASNIWMVPGDHNNLDPTGKLNLPVWADTTFILSASNKGDMTTTLPRSVTVNPVAISSFTASPAEGLRAGQELLLSWELTSASNGVITPISYNLTSDQLKTGSLKTKPLAPITYSLVAQNAVGSTSSALRILPMPLYWNQFSSGGPFRFTDTPVVVNYENTMYAMASGMMNSMYTSTDGQYWGPSLMPSGWPPRSNSAGLVFAGKIWLMGGINANGQCLNDVWCYDHGAWSQATAAATWGPRRSFGCFSIQDKLFVVGGIDDKGNGLNEVWSSADGITWTLENNQPFQSGKAAFATTVFNGQVWVLGGLSNGDESKGTPTNEVWYSSDGISWTLQPRRPGWAARSYPNAQAVAGALYLCGGLDSQGSPVYDLNKMNSSGTWAGMPGPPWKNIRLTASVAYQQSMWLLGGALTDNTPNPNVWAYSPPL